MSYIRIDNVGGVSTERLCKVLAGIPNGVYRATYSALKRAGDQAKTKAGQYAAAEYTISKGTFMSNVNIKTRITGAGSGAASMSLSFAGGVIDLLKFNTKFSKGGAVTTRVKRNGGGTLQHAFIATIGGTGVFERLSSKRFPVERKYGPSTGHMMQNDKVIEEMTKTIEETYDKRIEHEILRLLSGI